MNQANEIKSIVFLGSGNVATHLAMAMHRVKIKILQVFSPNIEHAKTLAGKINSQATNNISDIKQDADLYLISVSDDQIKTVAKEMSPFQGIVAHTSGIVEMTVLNKFENFGVFYPLQTFSKNRPVDMESVPFCIEGKNEKSWKALFNMAKKIGHHSVQYINSTERKDLHLAAVLVNNFTNHLYAQAEKLLEEKKMNFEILLPLIQETAAKLNQLQPSDAQTGPAKRKDLNTIKIHSEVLKNNPELLEIYQLFSHQILNKYHDQL